MEIKQRPCESKIQQDILLTFFNDWMLKNGNITEEQYRKINNKIIGLTK